MKQIILLILSLLIFTSIVSATSSEPLSNFVNVTPISGEIIPGDTYNFEYSFSSSHTTAVMINYSILYTENNSEEFKVNYSEWDVTFTLNDEFISSEEVKAGLFSSEEIPILTGDHNLNITVQSVPNILPGSYKLDAILLSEKIETIVTTIVKKSGGGSTRHYIITATPTPTPTKIVTLTETPTITVEQVTNNHTTKNINVSEHPLEPTNKNWLIYTALVLMIVALIVSIYYKKRKTNNN